VEIITPCTEDEGVKSEHDDFSFWIGISNPTVNKTYEVRITIEIGSVYDGDPSVEIEYMPFVQVKNIVAMHGSGTEEPLGNSIEKPAYGGGGSWEWLLAEGDYLWDWTIDQTKEANLNGYAYAL
jgi:hypothetical protein